MLCVGSVGRGEGRARTGRRGTIVSGDRQLPLFHRTDMVLIVKGSAVSWVSSSVPPRRRISAPSL